jgi:hypothetical protein
LKVIDPEDDILVRLPAGCLPILLAALRAAGKEESAEHVEACCSCYTDPEQNAERKRWLALAEDDANIVTTKGEIQFDEASPGGGGHGQAELLAWVTVEDPEWEPDEEEEAEDA